MLPPHSTRTPPCSQRRQKFLRLASAGNTLRGERRNAAVDRIVRTTSSLSGVDAMVQALDRRQVLVSMGAMGAGVLGLDGLSALADDRVSGAKLNLAVVGCGGQGFENLRQVSGENIVALCDVD